MSGWEGMQRQERTDGIDAFEVEDLLASLTEKCLVVADAAGRYRLLETVRDYGRGLLTDDGNASEMRRLHLTYFLALAEDAAPHLTAADQQTRLEQLDREYSNIRAALDSSQEAADGAIDGLRFVGALWRYWEIRGYLNEGRTDIDR